jgi:hypothetical protein
MVSACFSFPGSLRAKHGPQDAMGSVMNKKGKTKSAPTI